jgi:hypothetical protein
VSAPRQTPDSPEEQHCGEDLYTERNAELSSALEEAAAVADPTPVSQSVLLPITRVQHEYCSSQRFRTPERERHALNSEKVKTPDTEERGPGREGRESRFV